MSPVWITDSLFNMYIPFDLCFYYINAFQKKKKKTLFTWKVSFLYINFSAQTTENKINNNIATLTGSFDGYGLE